MWFLANSLTDRHVSDEVASVNITVTHVSAKDFQVGHSEFNLKSNDQEGRLCYCLSLINVLN